MEKAEGAVPGRVLLRGARDDMEDIAPMPHSV